MMALLGARTRNDKAKSSPLATQHFFSAQKPTYSLDKGYNHRAFVQLGPLPRSAHAVQVCSLQRPSWPAPEGAAWLRDSD